MCPNCLQPAPLVYHGGLALCSACGAERAPLSQRSINFAGEPQRFSGGILRAFGWFAFSLGLLIAAAVSGAGYWLFDSLGPAKYVGLPILTMVAMVAGSSLFAGRRLKARGEQSRREAMVEALRGLAAYRGGEMTARQAAEALQITEGHADDLLTEMAKKGEGVSVDVSEQGEVLYVFGTPRLKARVVEAPRRVATPAPGPGAESLEDLEVLQAEPEPPRAKGRA